MNKITDIVTMKAHNGRTLFLTNNDGVITWTYHRKYAITYYPEKRLIPSLSILKDVKHIKEYDKKRATIGRYNISVDGKLELLSSENVNDYIKRMRPENKGILK